MNKLQVLLANKHTTGAAIVYICSKILVMLGAIWLPGFKAQFDATSDLIESSAIAWGFLFAGDAKPFNNVGQQERNNEKATDGAC